MGDWKLKEPKVTLSKGEREWFDWAVSGAQEVLVDPDWLADNENALTVEGQLEDLRYRLDEQADEVLDGQTSDVRGGRRALNSLKSKLEKSGYYESASHMKRERKSHRIIGHDDEFRNKSW